MNLTKLTLYFFAIAILVLLGVSCESNGQSSKKSTDKNKTPVEEFSAFNRELIIPIQGDSISGYAFIASGETPKETVILIAGYPGNDNNFDIAHEIRRNGNNVIHFNHRGAWGSQGNYMYSNCLEDVSELIDYLSQNERSKDLRIDTTNFILLGRSYGGGIALIAGSQIDAVSKVVALSSVNYGEIMEKYKDVNELSAFKKYMQKQIMIKTNIDAFLQELLDNKIKYNITQYKELLEEKSVLLVEDTRKNESWIKELKEADYVLMESDHNFIDQRKELAKTIVDWIHE